MHKVKSRDQAKHLHSLERLLAQLHIGCFSHPKSTDIFHISPSKPILWRSALPQKRLAKKFLMCTHVSAERKILRGYPSYLELCISCLPVGNITVLDKFFFFFQ